jgi:hypothetical protein
MLSYGDRLVLINSVLSSLPMFMFSFLEIPKWVRKRLDFYRSRFFWQSEEKKRKYRLTKWNIICRPKEQGGLGIEVLDIKNSCLLSKWLFKLLNEEGVWQQLLYNKYLSQHTLAQVSGKPTDSPFWKGLMRVKEKFFNCGNFVIGRGDTVRFWEDTWLGDSPLAHQYPSLYGIVQRKHVMIDTVLNSTPINVSFRRRITGSKWLSWIHLCRRLMGISLNDNQDKFRWTLTRSGIFTVKSMYAKMINSSVRFKHMYLWKMKVPLKIKIFMWFLNKKILLTKDNLAKRNWNGSKKCCFCEDEESVHHLFISCRFARFIWQIVFATFNLSPPSSITNLFGNWLIGLDRINKARIRVGVSALCWSIWNFRNNIIFNGKESTNFLQVIFKMAHWIRLWRFLLPVEQRACMDSGCNRLLMVAQDIFYQATWRHTRRLEDV